MEYREDLKAFIDGELPAAKAESIQKAAESDPAIQRELDELRAVGGALHEMKQDHAVYGFEETLMALSGRRTGAPARKPNRKPWLGFGAGVAIAAVAAVIYAVPQIFNRPVSASRAMLASRSFSEKRTAASAETRMGRGAAKAPAATRMFQAPTRTPAPTLQDQVKQEQAQIQDLQKQVAQLKSKPATNGVEGTLPAPPLMSAKIVSAQPTVDGQIDMNTLPMSKGLPPNRIAALEAQVRKAALAAGAKVEVTGPPVVRSVSITVDSPKAPSLTAKIRAILKSAGTVTVEDIPQKPDDARTQSALDRIVDLKLQRDRLLQEYLPEAPQVKDLDTQIKVLQDSLKPSKETPKTRILVGIG